MDLAQRALPDLISRAHDLRSLVNLLSGEAVIGVDTESNSLFAYQEQVCLIQFSTSTGDYLVDPLALDDLSPLGPIFADPGIEKVFHAAEYDLICLRRDFNFTFANLFDTMWAARVLGYKEIGLSALLQNGFGVVADKRYQRADWGKRPLTAEMLAYARQDTHYLLPLREGLLAELKAKNRLALAVEDFRRMERLYERTGLNGNHAMCWERISGTRDLSPQQLAILRALCEYRENVARRRNRPVFKVIGDMTLVTIASACPVSLEELRSLPNISPRQVQQHGNALLEAVMEGLNAAPIVPAAPNRPDYAYLNRLEMLRGWRKKKAQELGVESDVVLPRDLMMEIVNRNPGTREDLEALLREVPWRRERFTGAILQELRNR
jgi:ribonuclease D